MIFTDTPKLLKCWAKLCLISLTFSMNAQVDTAAISEAYHQFRLDEDLTSASIGFVLLDATTRHEYFSDNSKQTLIPGH